VDESDNLWEEAATCRELAREITDRPSIAMFLDRAERLEARARAIETERRRRLQQDVRGAEPRAVRAGN
jgi:hypothetical protein